MYSMLIDVALKQNPPPPILSLVVLPVLSFLSVTLLFHANGYQTTFVPRLDELLPVQVIFSLGYHWTT